jgi:hypothetical protein
VHDVRDNVSIQDPFPLSDSAGHLPLSGAEWWGSGNSWNRADPPSAKDFRSLTPTGVDGPRAADGGLPDLPFMQPTASASPASSSRARTRGCGAGSGSSMLAAMIAFALSSCRRWTTW